MSTTPPAIPKGSGLAPSDSTAPPSRKVIVAIGVGQVIEWFDWTLYATFATFFAAQFFPAEGAGTALLGAFAIFAVGFLFRPLGGILLGHLADRFGRAAIFNLTVLAMAVGSLVIAVLPTYQSIGIFAPVLLLLARIVQGLSAGGEMPAATALVTELVPAARRAFYSSVIFVGIGIGVLMGTGMGFALSSLMSAEQMSSFGWRIAFGVGAVVGLFALVLRRSMRFAELEAEARAEDGSTPTVGHGQGPVRSFVDLWRKSPRGVLRIFGICSGGTIGFYALTVYMPTFLIRESQMDPRAAFLVTTIVMAVSSFLPPVGGMLADRFGRKPVMGFSALILAAATVPISLLLTANPLIAVAALLPLVVVMNGINGPLPALMSEQFPREVRGLGVGLAYSTATAIFGGTTTTVATWLASIGQPMWFFGYVALAFLVSAIFFFAMPETAVRTKARKEMGEPARLEA